MKIVELTCWLILATAIICQADVEGDKMSYGLQSNDRIVKMQQEFLALHGHVSWKFIVDKEASTFKYDDAESHLQVSGKALDYIKKYDTADLVSALWRYLDEPTYATDACICLHGAIGGKLHGSSSNIAHNVALCKWAVRCALGKDNDWSPHKIIFDREKVLADIKANPAARTNYIAAMQQVLAAPKIRSENPLEAKNVLGILCEMNAVETATNFCGFLFYDWKTGADHRIKVGDTIETGAYPASALAAIACLASFGDKCMPTVLDRFSNATSEECSVSVGGGGLPVLAIRYFYLQFMKEADAIKKIENYKKERRNLTEPQTAALNCILDAIRTKKYRPFFMEGSDWAAPKSVGTTKSPNK